MLGFDLKQKITYEISFIIKIGLIITGNGGGSPLVKINFGRFAEGASNSSLEFLSGGKSLSESLCLKPLFSDVIDTEPESLEVL